MNFVVIRWYKTPIIDVTSQICRDIIARLSFLNGLEAMVISAVETKYEWCVSYGFLTL